MEKKAGDWLVGFDQLKEETIYVHGGVDPDPTTGAIITPIYQNTTFTQESVERYLEKGYSYTRQDNPTVKSLETKIALIENGKFATCVASGMAATNTVLASLLEPDDHVLITCCSYGGTNRCARVYFSKYKIDFEFIDFRDVKNIEKRIKKNTKMLFSESPTNPTLFLADVQAISDLAKKHSHTTSQHQIYHVCDSTFATPVIMKPMDLGADVVLQSTTKYFCGHNVSIGGAIICNDQNLEDKFKLQRNICGNIMSPQTAFYQLITIKTLPLRIRKQSESAMKIAEFLETHPKVEKVGYPGLKSFPQRELAKKQHLHNLHGGMVFFEVKGGSPAGVKLMNTITRPWSLCENLGSTESIITCPSVFTHANMLKEDREKVGISDGFIRISVGVEDVDDLIFSLKEALERL